MNRFLLCFLLFSGLFSCTNDQLPQATVVECDTLISYMDTIKTIIDHSCAYDACHVAGFGTGDFSTYDGLRGVMGNGSFKVQVVDLRSMPPGNSPTGKPTELSEEDLMLIQCWIENDYPE